MAKKLIRMEDQKMIGGVCAGLADYLEIDVSLIRILFVAIFIVSAFFPMGLFYVIAWIVIPSGIKVTVNDEAETSTQKPGGKQKK